MTDRIAIMFSLHRRFVPLFVPALILAACAADARAWQPGEPPRTPRLPGFEIPPAPRDPEFPLLPGAIAPLEMQARPASPVVTGAPGANEPRARLELPPVETWDRTAERFAVERRGSPQQVAADDARAWTVGVALLVLFMAVVGVAAALALLPSRGAGGPMPIVRGGATDRGRS